MLRSLLHTILNPFVQTRGRLRQQRSFVRPFPSTLPIEKSGLRGVHVEYLSIFFAINTCLYCVLCPWPQIRPMRRCWHFDTLRGGGSTGRAASPLDVDTGVATVVSTNVLVPD